MHNKTRFILGASVALLALTGSALFMVNDASASSRNALSNQLTMARVAQPITESQTAAPPLAEDDSDEATVVVMEEEFDWFMIAASQLGMSEDELFEALDSGQTIADLATANGVEIQAIVDALIAAEADFIDSLLADGEISQEDATEWLAELPIYADEFVNETLDAYFEGVDWFQIAADTIGVDVDTLYEASSIADIAAEQDVDVQSVINAIVAAEDSFIDELVAAGDLTADEAAEWKAENAEYVGEFVTESFEFDDFYFEGADWFQIAADTLGVDVEALFEAESIAAVAAEQGVETQAIIDAIIAAEDSFIDELVAAGDLAADEAAEWKAENAEYASEFVTESFEFDDFYFEGADWFQIAADTLGVEVEALFEAESIAAVAAEQGVEVQTVIDAIVIAENAFVDELVASGDITAEEAAEWKAETVEFVTDVVENGFETFECEDGGHEEEIEAEPESEA